MSDVGSIEFVRRHDLTRFGVPMLESDSKCDGDDLLIEDAANVSGDEVGFFFCEQSDWHYHPIRREHFYESPIMGRVVSETKQEDSYKAGIEFVDFLNANGCKAQGKCVGKVCWVVGDFQQFSFCIGLPCEKSEFVIVLEKIRTSAIRAGLAK